MQSRSLRLLLFLTAIGFASPSVGLTQTRVVTPSAVGRIQSIGPVWMTVGNMDRSIDFYSRVLTFQKTSDTELAGDRVERLFGVFKTRVRVVRMTLGEESIELVEFLAPLGRPIPEDSRSNDLWFQHVAIIVSDMDRAYRILRQNNVEGVSSGPQRLPDWNQNAAGIQAFYFKDPDRHPLEILQFPEGKGDPKWRSPGHRLFQGIDHTAIAVANTDASLRFYRDVLGLRVAGESENYGTEQEHLNNVFGAHLRITSLRAPAGPGIELLEYLSPRDARPFPADERADDLVHRQTELDAEDAEATMASLRAAGVRFVSSGNVSFRERQLGFARGFIVRDPDGHALSIVQTFAAENHATQTSPTTRDRAKGYEEETDAVYDQ
jgi:catechol 2,3-dioxygenase-like lactoylglutathione lyase family enzyme